jgi:uncharacterized BrkB/YihY/UPF0761 family membrane protein
MGAIIGLMLWFYLTALAILIGAELNAEFAKQRGAGLICELPPHPEKPIAGPLSAA